MQSKGFIAHNYRQENVFSMYMYMAKAQKTELELCKVSE